MVGVLACPNISCVSRTYSKPQPVTQVNVHTSLYLSPDQLSEHLLSKHLTCVSRTHSQPQPVEISQTFRKHVVSGNQLTSHLHQMTLQPTCPQEVKQKHTSPESRILKLFDALDFTSATYQPSVDCKSLVQAQHASLQKIQELNTNDSSFTLDGVLSTLQQGSAENGVGSSVELRYHVKKRRAQICDQIQRFIKIPTELCRQTRTSTTHTKHKRSACSRKPNYTKALLCQESCFTLDSHMLTSDSFFSLQTQHDQSQGNTNTTIKQNKTTNQNRRHKGKIMCSLCRSVLCQVK